MAILSRMLRLCRADLHGVMDQLEDKDLLLKQYLREMEVQLQRKETRRVQLNDSCQQIRRDLDVRRSELQKVETDLDLAVTKDKDDIARMLIRKRWTLDKTCDQLQRQLDILEAEAAGVADDLANQRQQYDQLKIKAAAFSQMAEQQRFRMATPPMMSDNWQTPTDEEIELELLQRKEHIQQGGTP